MVEQTGSVAATAPVLETTKTLTAGAGLAVADMGGHALKGLDEPMRLCRVEG